MFEEHRFSISHLFTLSLKCQLALFDPLIGPYQVLPHLVSVDLGVMAIKEYSTFPKALRQKPYHQIVWCHIQDTGRGGGGYTPLQKSSPCILQPQPTWPGLILVWRMCNALEKANIVNDFVMYFYIKWFSSVFLRWIIFECISIVNLFNNILNQ